MIRLPSPNSELYELENLKPEQLLGLFESSLKSKLTKRDYNKLCTSWGILFSHLYLSHLDLEKDMHGDMHQLDGDKEQMLREFIRVDCAGGGTFVINVIEKGGMIDRSALIMIANLEDLAGVYQDNTTALHMLARACDKGIRPALIRKAGKKLLSNVYDHTGQPVLFLIFGLSSLCANDLDAIESLFSKEELRNVMVENRMGRNGLEVFSEIAPALRRPGPKGRKTDGKEPAENNADGGPIKTVKLELDSQKGADQEEPLKVIPLNSGETGQVSAPEIQECNTSPVSGPLDNVNTLMKIMIVDDDEILRSLLQIRLKTLGYDKFVMAGSGEDAVKLAHTTKPDLVFMDINMPGKMDGIAAAREIKAHMNSKIIFLTAYSDQEILVRARDVHPEGYIVKPYTNDDLRLSIFFLK